MSIRTAEAVWEGGLQQGAGRIKLASGLDCAYSLGTRFGEQEGSNPEELIGAALSGCFSMALAAALGKAGLGPQRIATTAAVHLEKVGEGYKITRIVLTTRARVEGADQPAFLRHAEAAKTTCPVSQALAGTKIELDARLE